METKRYHAQVRTISIAMLTVFLFTACEEVPADTIRARVEHVSDGDSFHARDHRGRKLEIRILGIDAPERHQPYAGEARAALIRMIRGKAVVLEVVEPDRHGRLVSRVTQNGVDVGLAQVRSGLAWTYPWAQTMPPGYRDAERVARRARRGLWRDPRAQPPWKFRQKK